MGDASTGTIVTLVLRSCLSRRVAGLKVQRGKKLAEVVIADEFPVHVQERQSMHE
jgi:hypothetical protein